MLVTQESHCAESIPLEQVVRLHFRQLLNRSVYLEDNSLFGPLYTSTDGKLLKVYIVLVKKNSDDSIIAKDQALEMLEKCLKELFDYNQDNGFTINVGYSVSVDRDVTMAVHIDILA